MNKSKKLTLALVLIVSVVAGSLMFGVFEEPAAAPVAEYSLESITQNNDVLGLKQLNPREFKSIFDSLGLPNLTPIVQAPVITGFASDDRLIRETAEARGYKMWSVPSLALVGAQKTELQPLAAASWKALEAAAKEDGINLKINYGYRSVDEQRQLFLASLASVGGRNVTAISKVLEQVAPPGYSKHHTGYTLDLADADSLGSTFEYTPAYRWLAKDNFNNSKRFGFIPSYPNGKLLQGPEPEPWEFVWVGEAVLRN